MEAVVKRDPRGQGERGEQLAALFGARGVPVFMPFFHSPRDFDFIVDWGDGVHRVQVKTSTNFDKRPMGNHTLCTRGGNRSWSGLVKRLDPTRYDLLFVVVADGRRWLIPALEVPGGSGLNLGGPKYAEYEIDPGEPLLMETASLDSAALRRDSRAVKGDGL